jgi:catechol 2,3-dioxygenase-like lactoylglutathione lyase family enzyme
MLDVLGFKKNTFSLSGHPHIQYYNRHFGYILRPADTPARHDSRSPGLHHFCFRVDTPEHVSALAASLLALGIHATEPRLYPEFAPDYWATFFADPDGIRLEVTNYRQERRDRHDNWPFV